MRPTLPAIPSIAELIREFPGLTGLIAEAEAVKDDQSKASFCANGRWYGGGRNSLRGRTVEIAHVAGHKYGWKAYDLIYAAVYDKLPDCRACGCVWPADQQDLRRDEVASVVKGGKS